MKSVSRVLLASVLVLCATTASAADTLGEIKKRGLMRLGYSETSAPFSFKGKDGSPAGYSVELCKRVSNAIQSTLGLPSLKTEWVALTPATRIDAVADGKVDIECGTTTTTLRRREKVDFSLPIFVDSSTVMARKSSASTFAELQGKKIAVAEGTTTMGALERALKRRFINAELVRTKTVAEGFEALKAGKADALAGDRAALVGTFLQGGGAEGLIVLDEDLSYEPYGLMLPKGDAAFRLAVDRTLAQIYRGEIEEIYLNWLGPLGKPTPPLIMLYVLNALPE